MGLDWMLYGRPAAGHEKEFTRLTERIHSLEGSCGDTKQKTLLQRLVRRREKIGVSSWEEIGCPRVGRDAAADRWLRRLYRSRHQDPEDDWAALSFEQVLRQCRGAYVEELAREPEGIALVQGPLASGLDFRGKVVGMAEELVGAELAEEAYEHHSAEECLELAAGIDQALGEHLASRRRGNEVLLVGLLAAVHWLRFWGGRGFGYEAWA